MTDHMRALCTRTFVPSKQTDAVRAASAVCAATCVLGTLMTFVNYSYAAFGLSATHFTAQSGVVHFARALSREMAPTFRFGVLGFGIGVCLILHTFLRAFYRDAYLEYVGGYPPAHAGQTLQVVVCHVLAPILSLLHAYKSPLVNPIYIALFVFVNVSLVVLLHEATAAERHLESTAEIVVAYVCALGAGFGTALIAETVARALR